jgi:hypothetical protein
MGPVTGGDCNRGPRRAYHRQRMEGLGAFIGIFAYAVAPFVIIPAAIAAAAAGIYGRRRLATVFLAIAAAAVIVPLAAALMAGGGLQ